MRGGGKEEKVDISHKPMVQNILIIWEKFQVKGERQVKMEIIG
jgi:hypothetical protein